MPVLEFKPDATHVAGIVGRSLGSGESFASLVSGAGTHATSSPVFSYVYIHADPSTTTWRDIFRMILCFDTSSLAGLGVTADKISQVRLLLEGYDTSIN